MKWMKLIVNNYGRNIQILSKIYNAFCLPTWYGTDGNVIAFAQIPEVLHKSKPPLYLLVH